MKRLFATLCTLAVLVVPGWASASTLVVFGQATGLNLFTGNETDGTTVLDAENVPIVISTLNDAASNIDAFFSFNAVSTAPATNVAGSVWAQSYDGMFSILGGAGFNYLSGTFSGVQLGLEGGRTYVFGAADPPLEVTFTSAVPGMPLDDPRALALSLTNVIPGVFLTNGSFGNFASNVAGTFSGELAVAPIPEPMSLLLLSSGFGLAAAAARRRKAKVKKPA